MLRISSARVSRSVGGLRVAATAAAVVAVMAAGCHSLEVTNPNDPDIKRALTTGTDLQSLLGGAYRNWFYGWTDYAPSLAASVMSDHWESAWGNWGMKLLGWEPRNYQITNLTTDAYDDFRQMMEEPWYNNYAALVSANLTIRALAGGAKIPGPIDSTSNPMMLGAARLVQGLALAGIALQFDSGYVFDEAYDASAQPPPTALKLVGRDSVERAALAKFDLAISLASGATTAWKIPATFLNQPGYNWNNTQIAQVANTMAARLIADFPKNATEDATLSSRWAKVLSYASKGISSGTAFDMNSDGDGGNNWYNQYLSMGDEWQVYIRVNFRTTCLLDPTYWCHRPNNADVGLPPKTADYRFNGDDVVGDNCIAASTAGFSNGYGQYCTAPGGYGGADFFFSYDPNDWTGYPPSRGYWRFSHVAHVRYYYYSQDQNTPWLGTGPLLLAAENDLLWAEALVNSGGSAATAAAKINKTRVTRGHLPALTGAEGAAALINAINYEYGIELYGTSPMTDWMVQRRRPDLVSPHYYTAANDSNQTGWTPFGTGLQPATPHLTAPPAKELLLLGDPIYTYGGPTLPEGAAPVRGSGPAKSIFGTTADGRPILGPGRWSRIADSLIAAHRPVGRFLRPN
jgi:hypothetical protein